jgi:hypothetical protein
METSRCYSRTTTHYDKFWGSDDKFSRNDDKCSRNDDKCSGNDDKCSGNDDKCSGNDDKSVLWDPYEFFTILNYFTFFSSAYNSEEQGISNENSHV